MQQYLLTPHTSEIIPWAYWENGFSEDELNRLEYLANNVDSQAHVVEGVCANIRRSKIDWLKLSPDTLWIYDKLGYLTSKLNADFFRFDLTCLGEPIQLTKYSSADSGMYNWHADSGSAGISRKLSLVLQLTDPNKYEGGDLEIELTPNVVRVPKKRGFLAAFPSFTKHRVTPVTSGERHSLVLWATGPRFR